jgi:hypothetical protein
MGNARSNSIVDRCVAFLDGDDGSGRVGECPGVDGDDSDEDD